MSTTLGCIDVARLPNPRFTMQEVRSRILDDTSLPIRKRKDLAWALMAVARAFMLPPEKMPADPAFISQRLSKFAPVMAGFTLGTWKNALTLTRFAFRRVGIIKTPARRIERFAPKWTEVMRLPSQKFEQIALSRLARFCSEQHIDPDDVDDTVFARLLDSMTSNTVRPGATKAHRQAAVVWNRLANSLPNWPSAIVTVPSYSKVYFLGWDKFQASLVADIDAHLAQLSGADILSDLDVRPLKASSLRTRRLQLGAYLSGLVLSGEDPEELRTLADVVKIGRVKRGLRFLLNRTEHHSKSQALDTARMLLSVARHWVDAPETQLDELRRLCKRLDDDKPGLTFNNRTRLRQFDETDNMARLHDLPALLLTKARRVKGPVTPDIARLVQTALCIELLLMLPMRRENLARLNLDRHIVRQNGKVYLMIDGGEVKNGVDIEAILPSETVRLLDIYLKTYRPLLTDVDTPWLFPGMPGRSKSRERLALQVSKTIREELGLQVHLHLFRHISAKFYLDRHPGAYGVVQKLHGHKSIQTTMRSYCGLEDKAAFEHFDNEILNFRKKPKH